MLDSNDDRVEDSDSQSRTEDYDKFFRFVQTLTTQVDILNRKSPTTVVKEKKKLDFSCLCFSLPTTELVTFFVSFLYPLK